MVLGFRVLRFLGFRGLGFGGLGFSLGAPWLLRQRCEIDNLLPCRGLTWSGKEHYCKCLNNHPNNFELPYTIRLHGT